MAALPILLSVFMLVVSSWSQSCPNWNLEDKLDDYLKCIDHELNRDGRVSYMKFEDEFHESLVTMSSNCFLDSEGGDQCYHADKDNRLSTYMTLKAMFGDSSVTSKVNLILKMAVQKVTDEQRQCIFDNIHDAIRTDTEDCIGKEDPSLEGVEVPEIPFFDRSVSNRNRADVNRILETMVKRVAFHYYINKCRGRDVRRRTFQCFVSWRPSTLPEHCKVVQDCSANGDCSARFQQAQRAMFTCFRQKKNEVLQITRDLADKMAEIRNSQFSETAKINSCKSEIQTAFDNFDSQVDWAQVVQNVVGCFKEGSSQDQIREFACQLMITGKMKVDGSINFTIRRSILDEVIDASLDALRGLIEAMIDRIKRFTNCHSCGTNCR